MAEMVIEVPENWIAFFQDVAERMKEEPAKYWGNYLVTHYRTAMHDDHDWVFGGLQRELIVTHGLTLEDPDD